MFIALLEMYIFILGSDMHILGIHVKRSPGVTARRAIPCRQFHVLPVLQAPARRLFCSSFLGLAGEPFPSLLCFLVCLKPVGDPADGVNSRARLCFLSSWGNWLCLLGAKLLMVVEF